MAEKWILFFSVDIFFLTLYNVDNGKKVKSFGSYDWKKTINFSFEPFMEGYMVLPQRGQKRHDGDWKNGPRKIIFTDTIVFLFGWFTHKFARLWLFFVTRERPFSFFALLLLRVRQRINGHVQRNRHVQRNGQSVWINRPFHIDTMVFGKAFFSAIHGYCPRRSSVLSPKRYWSTTVGVLCSVVAHG